MIRHVCYHDEACAPEDRLFQIVAFRMFSKIETWEVVRDFLGHHPTLRDLADGSFTQALEAAHDKNGVLYTHAFILCAADAFGQGRTYLNHVALFRHMFLGDELGKKLQSAASLEAVLSPSGNNGHVVSFKITV
jgi:hypothetical protein